MIPVTLDTSVEDVMVKALDQFGFDSCDLIRYRMVEVSQEKGGKNCFHCNKLFIRAIIHFSRT